MSLESSPAEHHESSVEIPEGLDGVLAHAAHLEEKMRAGETRAAESLRTLEASTPEEVERIVSLEARLKELPSSREDLATVARDTALSAVLTDPSQESLSSEDRAELLANLLTNNPELARTLMQSLLGASEGLRVAGQGGIEQKLPSFSEEAKEILEEIDASDKKVFKGLALRTVERVVRAAISASTLGIGGIAYDTIKDVYASMRARKELRTRRASLLASGHA